MENNIFLSINCKNNMIYEYNKTEDYKRLLEDYINSFNKQLEKNILLKKKDYLIAVDNIFIEDKLYNIFSIYKTTPDTSNSVNNLLKEIVTKVKEYFSINYLLIINKNSSNNFGKDIITNCLSEYKKNKSKYEEIENELRITTELSKESLTNFVNRGSLLTELNSNTAFLEQSAMEFQSRAVKLKRYYFLQKWKLIVIIIGFCLLFAFIFGFRFI